MADRAIAGRIHVNGVLLDVGATHISALDRGFALGDGVFDTLRVIGGRAFRLEDHLARLRDSARVLQMSIPRGNEELAGIVDEVLQANELGDAIVRLTVSRGVAADRGLVPIQSAEPTIVVQAHPFKGLPEKKLHLGLSARISSIRRNEHSPVSRIKSCNYLDSLLSRLEAHHGGMDEGIMLNSSGYVACGSTANLHVVSDGQIRTPALACGVLSGIIRQVVRELAAFLGLVWEEGYLRPDDVKSADEVFLTNSVIGVAPLTRIDGVVVGSGRPGPITLLLMRDYEALLRT